LPQHQHKLKASTHTFDFNLIIPVLNKSHADPNCVNSNQHILMI